MSFIPVFTYTIGIAVFGFVYWLLDGIMDSFRATGIHETGTIFDLLLYLWAGILIVYLVFGGWWVIRKYNEEEYMYGGRL